VPALLDDVKRRSQILAGVIAACAALAGGLVSWNALTAHAVSPRSAVASQFAALDDSSLPGMPDSALRVLRSIHDWRYDRARTVGPKMYLAAHDGVLCELVTDGSGGCTDRLDPSGVWLFGDMTRRYDSETAPFDVHLYGFAVDGVSGIEVTANGVTTSLSVRHNAFETTLRNLSFSDISAVSVVKASGERLRLDPAAYFPHMPLAR
jgi:hypothetical protein